MRKQQRMDRDRDNRNGKVIPSTADKDGPRKAAIANDNERKLQLSGPDHGGGGGVADATRNIINDNKKSLKSKSREERPSSLSLAAVAVRRLKVSATPDFNAQLEWRGLI